MKKFILKTAIFVFPFIILYLINIAYYTINEGDLVRLGFLYENPTPKSSIDKQYNFPKRYTLLSEIDITKKSKFNIMTIGDSFSDRGNLGYNNILANKGVSVLNIDRNIAGENPNQILIQLLNSNFFDQIEVEYVVLQSVERIFKKRTEELDFDLGLELEAISKMAKNKMEEPDTTEIKFFSNATALALISNIGYCFRPNSFFSGIYKCKISSNLFSNNPDNILFLNDDYSFLDKKNDSVTIYNGIEAIEKINALAAKRNIKLMVLISPDKYDLYYNYLVDKEKMQKPLFFSLYNQAPKSYINIDAYGILTELMDKEKDLYYYDDTHWSPKSAEIIANEILRYMK